MLTLNQTNFEPIKTSSALHQEEKMNEDRLSKLEDKVDLIEGQTCQILELLLRQNGPSHVMSDEKVKTFKQRKNQTVINKMNKFNLRFDL